MCPGDWFCRCHLDEDEKPAKTGDSKLQEENYLPAIIDLLNSIQRENTQDFISPVENGSQAIDMLKLLHGLFNESKKKQNTYFSALKYVESLPHDPLNYPEDKSVLSQGRIMRNLIRNERLEEIKDVIRPALRE